MGKYKLSAFVCCLAVAVGLIADSYSPGPSMRVVARVNITGQTANIASTPLFTVPSGPAGMYLYCPYTTETTAAGTSSTLPNATVTYTDNDSNTTVATAPLVNLSSGFNAVATTGGLGSAPTSNCFMFQPRPGTVINFATLNYASVNANVMTYSLHARLIYLGL